MSLPVPTLWGLTVVAPLLSCHGVCGASRVRSALSDPRAPAAARPYHGPAGRAPNAPPPPTPARPPSPPQVGIALQTAYNLDVLPQTVKDTIDRQRKEVWPRRPCRDVAGVPLGPGAARAFGGGAAGHCSRRFPGAGLCCEGASRAVRAVRARGATVARLT